MGLNRDFIGREFGPEFHMVDKFKVMAYASAIGAQYINYLDSGGSEGIVPLLFSVTYEIPLIYKLLADPNLHGSQEQMKENMLMLVHGDQQIKLHNPLKPGDRISCRARVMDIEDMGSGEIIRINMLSSYGEGTKMVESDWGLFIRGIGSGKRPVIKKRAPKPVPGPVVFSRTIRMPIDITYKYSKASNDMNPIHLDGEVAKKAGLDGIVVHGLCTLSMSVQAAIDALLEGDAAKLLSLGARFLAPVYPGDELVVEGRENADSVNKIIFEVSRKSDGVKVIKSGRIDIQS